MLRVMPHLPSDMEQKHWLACVLMGCGVPHRTVAVRVGASPRSIEYWSKRYSDLIEDIRISKEAFNDAVHSSNLAISNAMGFDHGQQLLAQPADRTTSDLLQYAKYVETMHRINRPESASPGPNDRDRPKPVERRSAALELRSLDSRIVEKSHSEPQKAPNNSTPEKPLS